MEAVQERLIAEEERTEVERPAGVEGAVVSDGGGGGGVTTVWVAKLKELERLERLPTLSVDMMET